MTKFINVKKLLEDRGMNKTQIGALLFPNVKFPKRAFSRVLTGETELSASQIAILAEHLGVSVNDLFEPDTFRWENSLNGTHVFVYGNNFRAEVNTETWETILYYKDQIFDRGVFCDGTTPISEFRDIIKNKVQDWIDLS